MVATTEREAYWTKQSTCLLKGIYFSLLFFERIMGSSSNHFTTGANSQIRRLLQLSSSEGLWWCWRSTGICMDSCCHLQKFSRPCISWMHRMHLLVDSIHVWIIWNTARLKGSMELSIMSIAYLELLSCSIFPQAAYLHGIKRRWIVMESSFFL